VKTLDLARLTQESWQEQRDKMRTFQAFFHINPDYAYWYGWAAMVKGLGEIQETAKAMRAAHGKAK
jgi:hydroxylamine dehydrogenase